MIAAGFAPQDGCTRGDALQMKVTRLSPWLLLCVRRRIARTGSGANRCCSVMCGMPVVGAPWAGTGSGELCALQGGSKAWLLYTALSRPAVDLLLVSLRRAGHLGIIPALAWPCRFQMA